MFAGSAAPAGYLLCNGAAVSRSTYAQLFAAIGSTYGAGDGSTTFNLPNLLGRVAIGAGVSAASGTNRTIGATGGEDSHVLTTAELPAHTHAIPTLFRTGLVMGNGAGAELGDTSAGSAGSLSSSSTGSGAAHNVLQPYLALNYIIKT
jgi:microcystin-dependent protein